VFCQSSNEPVVREHIVDPEYEGLLLHLLPYALCSCSDQCIQKRFMQTLADAWLLHRTPKLKKAVERSTGRWILLQCFIMRCTALACLLTGCHAFQSVHLLRPRALVLRNRLSSTAGSNDGITVSDHANSRSRGSRLMLWILIIECSVSRVFARRPPYKRFILLVLLIQHKLLYSVHQFLCCVTVTHFCS
jgi:hypothetical protein